MFKLRPVQAVVMPLILALCMMSLFSIAQTVEYDHALFSFKVHDNLKYDVLEGFPVYTSGTIFLNIKSVDTYKNAAKYADALESKFLDQDDVYTERGIDTLDGWPMIYLVKRDESKENHFVQRFYFFDDGKTAYNLSISGYKMDENVIKDYFSVTKNSFKFKTTAQSRAGLTLMLPKFMGEDPAVGFWSRLYNKDEAVVDIPIRCYHDATVKYEDDIKETVKSYKSMKPSVQAQEEFTIANGVRVTKYTLTYVKKLKTTSEEESKWLFIIAHPEGGTLTIHFAAQPAIAALLGPRLERVIKAASF